MVKVTIIDFKVKDPINGDSTPSCYFVIHYHDEDINFATKRFTATEDQLHTLNWDYDVDVPETATSVYIDFEAVADEAGSLGDDIQLDIDSDGTNQYGITWTISSSSFVGENEGSGSSNDDAYIKVQLSKQIQTKARVIVINGTDADGGDYGLYKVGTNNYRFNADQQVYMLQLYVNSSSTHFQQGMNTIILPRAIALECKLNYTLSHLGTMNNADPLRNAEFYYTDSSQAVSSAHVIATISKTVTAAQAEWILTNLTKNSAGERIGNNVTISTTSALYLLHLPNDVLSSVPSLIDNDGLGNMPDYLGITGILSDIGDFLFDSLVFVATGGLLFLLLHLTEIGLKKLRDLIVSAAADVKGAVDEMAKALNDMLDWVVEFIQDTLDSLFGPVVETIQKMGKDYCMGVAAASASVSSDIKATNSISDSSKSQLLKAILGNLFTLLAGVTIIVMVAMTIVSAVTGPFGFLVGIVIGMISSIIMESALNAAMTAIDFVINVSQSLNDVTMDLLTWSGANWSPGDILSTIIDWLIGMFEFLGTAFIVVCVPKEYQSISNDLALSVAGLILSVYSVGLVDDDASHVVDVVGLMLSLTAAYFSFKDMFMIKKKLLPDKSPFIVLGVASFISLAGVGKSIFDVCEDYYG
jgi:hypothetical protein